MAGTSVTPETWKPVKTHFSAKTVETVIGARVSVPCCVAVAGLDRAVGQAQFRLERVRQSDVQFLLARTDVVSVPELTQLYPDSFPARVSVVSRDGPRLQATRYVSNGDPREPLSAREIETKFHANAAELLDAARAMELVDLIRELPALADGSPLAALLAGIAC